MQHILIPANGWLLLKYSNEMVLGNRPTALHDNQEEKEGEKNWHWLLKSGLFFQACQTISECLKMLSYSLGMKGKIYPQWTGVIRGLRGHLQLLKKWLIDVFDGALGKPNHMTWSCFAPHQQGSAMWQKMHLGKKLCGSKFIMHTPNPQSWAGTDDLQAANYSAHTQKTKSLHT